MNSKRRSSVRPKSRSPTEKSPTDFKGFVAASLLHAKNDLCRLASYFRNAKIIVSVSGCRGPLCLDRDLFSGNGPVVCATDSELQARIVTADITKKRAVREFAPEKEAIHELVSRGRASQSANHSAWVNDHERARH